MLSESSQSGQLSGQSSVKSMSQIPHPSRSRSHPSVRTHQPWRGAQDTRARRIPFGSIIGPTGVTVSLHAKGFAHRLPWAPSRQRRNSPATFDASRRPAQHANARVRPRRHRSLGRRAALTSPKDQLKRERWRRWRRLFRVSCGRELTGTRALIGKGERYYTRPSTHAGTNTATRPTSHV